MFSRRSFFRRLGAVVAVVALAPEIAFASKLSIPKVVWGLAAFDKKLHPYLREGDSYLRMDMAYETPLFNRYIDGRWMMFGARSGGKSGY